MDSQNAPANGAAGQTNPDEARIKDAMQRLKLLHIKNRNLRDVIAKVLEPLFQQHPNPETMFAAFMKGVHEAQANIKEFQDLMKDDKSQEVFAMADKSREENPFGIVPWRHKEHPNWFNLDKDD